MRPIDADVVIGRYYADWEYHCIEMGEDDRQWLKQCIEQAPTLTLDDLRPKGRWERNEDGKVCCSVCKKKALEVKKGVWHIPNFCNHCGADMRGGGEDG